MGLIWCTEGADLGGAKRARQVALAVALVGALSVALRVHGRGSAGVWRDRSAHVT